MVVRSEKHRILLYPLRVKERESEWVREDNGNKRVHVCMLGLQGDINYILLIGLQDLTKLYRFKIEDKLWRRGAERRTRLQFTTPPPLSIP